MKLSVTEKGLMRAGLGVVLALLPAAFAMAAEKEIAASDYREKVYASWIGQCVGNMYGLPHENDYIDAPGPDKFPYGYQEGVHLERMREANGVYADDDTDIEYVYLLTMEKFGPEPTLRQLGEMWKHHVRDRVWLANRAGLAALNFGYTPPVTGYRENNPHWFQIDPQLINEIWGVTAPGMIEYAAAKSGWAARIMDDSWGIEPTIFYGAMFAAAFFETDMNTLIEIGTAQLPKDGRFINTVARMRELHAQYPSDWQAARKVMAQEYYIDEPLEAKTIWNANLNAACGVLAMLYGEGDFQRTLDLNCAMGFDADNQAATIAGIMAVRFGMKGIPAALLEPLPDRHWTEPFNDFYLNNTRFDIPNASLKNMAARMALQGERLILATGGKRAQVNGEDGFLINADAAFVPPFEFPAGPRPLIETGKALEWAIPLFGGTAPYAVQVLLGELPSGLHFENGVLSGTAEQAGVYPIVVEAQDSAGVPLTQTVQLMVRGPNLAPSAKEILANVRETNTARRDKLWLTVPASLYAPSVEVIRDGKTTGDGSTFYSIDSSEGPRQDYYGYTWETPQRIGLLGFHTGAMEEMAGWFTSLNVEYQDEGGAWQPVKKLVVDPQLLPGEEPYNKAHFVEYLLPFEPVSTRGIRIIGDAAGIPHWATTPKYKVLTFFTSISELTVHGPLPPLD
ncbi:MAG: ADP-ribosylglycohydrolase family protein [Candidatus Hydrogenedentes bacterium]|nr:ADP-ribosylglycohydrolase family protein [Candidatus Hydrogenedentota bacterium]